MILTPEAEAEFVNAVENAQYGSDSSGSVALVQALRGLALEVAALRRAVVSATTPTQPGWFKDGPHSRACGIVAHRHGASCHPNCPTCGGRAS